MNEVVEEWWRVECGESAGSEDVRTGGRWRVRDDLLT